ncbi:MAG TPA: hypothetical protein PLR25_08675 [Planctomycetaceae bacterium]|nr:hypothetical protein [Planctomycetaceae bacterium]
MTRIDVTTGSRLHFGLICGSPSTAWRFGGIGVMLRQPGWQLSVDNGPADDDRISASTAVELRIREFLQRIRKTLPCGPLQIHVTGSVPFHTGLGGGTQLGLALAAAAELLTNRRLGEDPFQLAECTGRAERSAIGTIGFVQGGFLVDHGHEMSGSTNRRVDRHQFPEAWRFVLVRPTDSEGISGHREQTFFARHRNMPRKLVAELESQILEGIVPSIDRLQFSKFAESVEHYGISVGRFYSAEQGGVFSHPAMIQLASLLRAEGVFGMAQSSWGPCIAIPAESHDHATQIAGRIPESTANCHLNISIAEAMNNGASIRTPHDDSWMRPFQ